LRKEGSLYDLPIALGLLLSLRCLDSNIHHEYLVVGELGLSGETRSVKGALAFALLARQLGMKGILVPAANVCEASAVPNIKVFGIQHLKQAVEFFKNPQSLTPSLEKFHPHISSQPLVDFADIKGQMHVKRAAEIAAAGSHNILLSGPPGSGKTLIAKALVGIIPEMYLEEALEVTKIYSIAGMLREGQGIITQRPFRSPHHTVSYAGLIGGGSNPKPGEVSLAHHGILFLDELPEFSRHVLEVLRQPLEDRQVTISRAQGSFTYPTNILCIAAMNPCPCGYLGHPDKKCTDTELQINRYHSKISGPLWDRLDMHIDVPALRYSDMLAAKEGESSAVIRERVKLARRQQRLRFNKTNAAMSPREIKEVCRLDQHGQEAIKKAMDTLGLSARALNRILKVSRTIADLAGTQEVLSDHVLEAISFRDFGNLKTQDILYC
jgi:magnesium chelatase family protein